MNQLSVLLKKISNIAKTNPAIIEILTRQLSKMAENNSIDIVELTNQISQALEKCPEYKEDLLDSISDGQIYSKNWIIEELKDKPLGNIFICAGWFSTLLVDSRLKFEKCVSIDIDPRCEKVNKILHKKYLIDSWKFQSVTENIHNIDYSRHAFNIIRNNGTLAEMVVVPNTIINTSCEHIENFEKWYGMLPSDKLLILQTNNGFDIPDHVNCVSSLEEFEKQTPMKTVIYSEKKEMPKFTRYMRMGYK
jgi:hypothetical protein